MTAPTPTRRYTSVGFYFPCYPSGFFSQEVDRGLLNLSYAFDKDYGPYSDQDHVKLDATIFARLLMVLPRKGFTTAYPIFPEPKPTKLEHVTTPTGIVFLLRDVNEAISKVRAAPPLPKSQAAADPATHLLPLSKAGVESLALVVNHDGYYVWLATYVGNEGREWFIRNALREHIYHLVGGDFGSHEQGKGLASDGSSAQPSTQPPATAKTDLTTYTQNHIGCLTFTQLNTVLEGLYNLNLDPRVFFHNEEAVGKQYTLGRFFAAIVADFHPAKRPPRSRRELISGGKIADEETPEQKDQRALEEQLHTSVLDRFFGHFLQDATRSEATVSISLIHDFADVCLNHNACEHLLNSFLSSTELVSLKPIKGWIERCRRALIDELIEVTHRRIPLVQAKPPDGPIDRIEDVTEAQLRGYVMFLSAKLPLISNVLLHLEDLHYEVIGAAKHRRQSHSRQIEEQFADPEGTAVYGPFNSWRGMLRAIQNDLRSLTDAINQARTDRMLYEQEQIHAEQETLAEIERLNDRATEAAGPESGVVSMISNFLALLSVILATGPSIKNGRLVFSPNGLLSILNSGSLPGAEELLIVLLILAVIYIIIHFGAERLARWVVKRFLRKSRHEAKYYYEMDIHADAPFLAESIPELVVDGISKKQQPETPLDEYLQAGSNGAYPKAQGDVSVASAAQATQSKTLDFKKVVRNSYRVERQEKSEALHKIYVETEIRVSARRFMHVVLVYELLYHRPSSDHDYILKDLRVVSTHSDELTEDEVIRLKAVVVYYFLNPYLEEGWRLVLPLLKEQSNNVSAFLGNAATDFDSLFTITQIPATPKQSSLSQ